MSGKSHRRPCSHISYELLHFRLHFQDLTRGSGTATKSLPQAIALAKLQEDKLNDHQHPVRNMSLFSSPTPTTVSPHSPSPSKSKVDFNHLSSTEITSRHEQGLCYHYNKKWIVGHRCKGHILLLIADDDDGLETPSALILLLLKPPLTRRPCPLHRSA